MFAANLNLLIPISLKPNGVISNLGFFIAHKIHSLKYQKSTTSGWTDLSLESLAKYNFLHKSDI